MSILYLHFDTPERGGRIQKLSRSGAHIVASEPRWPGFHEVAKKEKPSAIAIDFSLAPSHCLETADYLAKAKETRETPLYLIRVPEDRVDLVKKRLPQAIFVTEQELSGKLAQIEKDAAEKARQKKEAAAEARKLARAKSAKAGVPPAGKPAPAPKAKKPAASPKASGKKRKPAPAKKGAAAKRAARVPKKK
ncbi:MAG TPA: hypothetical protein VMR54_06745 [Thermoanaerobaculia bacterium]|nr:hypothetical protein [Thermoanaerobaculia bacterium]